MTGNFLFSEFSPYFTPMLKQKYNKDVNNGKEMHHIYPGN